MQFNWVDNKERLQSIAVSGFVIFVHAMHSLCFTWYSFIHWCGGKKEQFVWKRKRFFPPSLPLSTFHCLSVWRVPVFSRVWGLMAGLPGFASNQCSLRRGAGCQKWKLQDGSDTQRPLNDAVVNYTYHHSHQHQSDPMPSQSTLKCCLHPL